MDFSHLAEPVVISMAVVFAVLVTASIVIAVVRRRHPGAVLGPNLAGVQRRLTSWWVMAAVFLVAVALHRGISVAFLALVSYLALKEYLSLVPTRRADRRVLLLAYVAVPLQYWWILDDWYGLAIVFVPVYAFLALPAGMVIFGETRGFLAAAATLHWGLMTTVFSLSHTALLLVLPGDRNPPSGGPGLLLFLLVLTQGSDVLRKLWDRAAERMGATLSGPPGRTLGGLIGAVTTTTLLSYLLSPVLTPLVGHHQFLAGAMIGLASFLGDLSVTTVKRDLGVSDPSAPPSGMGGVLDRIDSLVFTAPLFFHYVRYLHY